MRVTNKTRHLARMPDGCLMGPIQVLWLYTFFISNFVSKSGRKVAYFFRKSPQKLLSSCLIFYIKIGLNFFSQNRPKKLLNFFFAKIGPKKLLILSSKSDQKRCLLFYPKIGPKNLLIFFIKIGPKMLLIFLPKIAHPSCLVVAYFFPNRPELLIKKRVLQRAYLMCQINNIFP